VITTVEIKSVPLFIAAGLAGLIFLVLLIGVTVALVRRNRKQIVAAGPLVEEQEFELSEAIPLLLMVEVPRIGSRFRELQFQILEKVTGTVTSLSYNFVRAQGAVYGVTTMRVPIGRLQISRPGSYLVRVIGLQPGGDLSRSRILLSRPYLRRMVLQIISIVICGIGLLLSLLLALWQVLPLQQG
jgi:hypothetical protein